LYEKLNLIKNKLKNFNNISYNTEDNILTVFPKKNTGFTVSFVITDKKYYVYYDVWNVEFKNINDAIDCFAFGLTNQCRLKVKSRGSKDYKWVLEYNDKGDWKEYSYTSVINLNLFGQKNTRYLTNDIIKNINDLIMS